MDYNQKTGVTGRYAADKYVRRKKCPNCGGIEWTESGNLRVLGKIIKSYECKDCGARST